MAASHTQQPARSHLGRALILSGAALLVGCAEESSTDEIWADAETVRGVACSVMGEAEAGGSFDVGGLVGPVGSSGQLRLVRYRASGEVASDETIDLRFQSGSDGVGIRIADGSDRIEIDMPKMLWSEPGRDDGLRFVPTFTAPVRVITPSYAYDTTAQCRVMSTIAFFGGEVAARLHASLEADEGAAHWGNDLADIQCFPDVDGQLGCAVRLPQIVQVATDERGLRRTRLQITEGEGAASLYARLAAFEAGEDHARELRSSSLEWLHECQPTRGDAACDAVSISRSRSREPLPAASSVVVACDGDDQVADCDLQIQTAP